jgi:hypothetical protein
LYFYAHVKSTTVTNIKANSYLTATYVWPELMVENKVMLREIIPAELAPFFDQTKRPGRLGTTLMGEATLRDVDSEFVKVVCVVSQVKTSLQLHKNESELIVNGIERVERIWWHYQNWSTTDSPTSGFVLTDSGIRFPISVTSDPFYRVSNPEDRLRFDVSNWGPGKDHTPPPASDDPLRVLQVLGSLRILQEKNGLINQFITVSTVSADGKPYAIPVTGYVSALPNGQLNLYFYAHPETKTVTNIKANSYLTVTYTTPHLSAPLSVAREIIPAELAHYLVPVPGTNEWALGMTLIGKATVHDAGSDFVVKIVLVASEAKQSLVLNSPKQTIGATSVWWNQHRSVAPPGPWAMKERGGNRACASEACAGSN